MSKVYHVPRGLIRPPLPELASLGPVPSSYVESIDFDFEPTWKEMGQTGLVKRLKHTVMTLHE